MFIPTLGPLMVKEAKTKILKSFDAKVETITKVAKLAVTIIPLAGISTAAVIKLAGVETEKAHAADIQKHEVKTEKNLEKIADQLELLNVKVGNTEKLAWCGLHDISPERCASTLPQTIIMK